MHAWRSCPVAVICHGNDWRYLVLFRIKIWYADSLFVRSVVSRQCMRARLIAGDIFAYVAIHFLLLALYLLLDYEATMAFSSSGQSQGDSREYDKVLNRFRGFLIIAAVFSALSIIVGSTLVYGFELYRWHLLLHLQSAMGAITAFVAATLVLCRLDIYI